MEILVVDDDLTFARSFGRWLHALGWQTQLAHTGEDALAAARTSAVQLALVDMLLPDVDGIQVCSRLRGLMDGAVALYTGIDDAAARTRATAAGVDDYIVKSVGTAKALKRRLEKLVERRSPWRDIPVLDVNRQFEAITVNGHRLSPLESKTEYLIMDRLHAAAGQVVSRAEVLDYLRSNVKTNGRAVDVHLARLLTKLGAAAVLIQPVPGGWRLHQACRFAPNDEPRRRPPIRIGALVIDETSAVAFRAGVRIKITPMEFTLLHILASAGGRPLERAEVARRLFGSTNRGWEERLGMHLTRLRRKLGDAASYLRTIRERNALVLSDTEVEQDDPG